VCLTIPKKVISIDKDFVTCERPDGTREMLKSIISVAEGDYVFSQQKIIIQKMDPADAEEILDLFQQGAKNEKNN
jgi:hydrogenase maturation factor